MTTRIPFMPLPAEVSARLVCELFANVWNSCFDSDEAARFLGLPHDTAASWAAHYRALGIELKDLPRKEGRAAYLVREVLRYIEPQRLRSNHSRRLLRRRQ